MNAVSPAGGLQRKKIARQEWPAIAARYHQGESLASIARSYDCTPPAIRYIVHRGSLADGGRNRPVQYGATVEQPVADPTGQIGCVLSVAPELGSALRDAVTAEIANFMVSLDRAVDEAPPSLDALRRACDQLMRAVARVRIAVESGRTAAELRGAER